MASRTKRGRVAAHAGKKNIWRRGKWWLVGGGVIAVIAVLLVLTSALSGPATTGGNVSVGEGPAPSVYDFPVDLYQGAELIGSNQVQFSSLLGNKPIVLNYWASNCPPCAAEMPEFERVWQKYQGQVLFFGMDVGRFAGFGGPEDSKQELRRLGVTYPAAPVPNIETAQALQVVGLPSTDFITPDGKVHRKWVGILNEAKLTEIIGELLEAS